MFIHKKVHHAVMIRRHRKISDNIVHCFQITPFINWPLSIMIFINRKERSKLTVDFSRRRARQSEIGLISPTCLHFTHLSPDLILSSLECPFIIQIHHLAFWLVYSSANVNIPSHILICLGLKYPSPLHFNLWLLFGEISI